MSLKKETGIPGATKKGVVQPGATEAEALRRYQKPPEKSFQTVSKVFQGVPLGKTASRYRKQFQVPHLPLPVQGQTHAAADFLYFNRNSRAHGMGRRRTPHPSQTMRVSCLKILRRKAVEASLFPVRIRLLNDISGYIFNLLLRQGWAKCRHRWFAGGNQCNNCRFRIHLIAF